MTTELKLISIEFGRRQIPFFYCWINLHNVCVWIRQIFADITFFWIFNLHNYLQYRSGKWGRGEPSESCVSIHSMMPMMTSMSWTIGMPFLRYMPNVIHVVNHIFHTIHLHFLFLEWNFFSSKIIMIIYWNYLKKYSVAKVKAKTVRLISMFWLEHFLMK